MSQTRKPRLPRRIPRKRPQPRPAPPQAAAGLAHFAGPAGLLDGILERVNDGIVAFDSEFNYTYVNRAGGELLGRRPEDLIGKNYWTEYPEARGTPFANAYLRAMETQQPVSFEDYYAHWDRWFANRIFPSQGGITIFFSDVTERKRTELAWHAAKSRLEAIINVSPLAITMLDLDDNVQIWNPAAERIFGWSASEVLGKPNPVVGPDMQAEYARWSAEVFQETPIINREAERLRKDGSRIQVTLSSAPIRDSNGCLVGRMGIFTDASEKKRAEEDIHQRNTELAVLNQAGQALSRLGEPGQIFERIYSAIGQLLDNRNLYIALYDAGRQWITFPLYMVDGKPLAGRERPLGDGITDHIIRTNAPFLAKRNLPEALRQAGAAMLGKVSRSYMGVPIRSGSQVTGVIALQDYEREDIYDERHVELLTTIAAQVSNALENARLYSAMQQELEERKRTEAALRESERRFATAFQNAPVLISISDLADSTYVDVNEEALRISGFRREEVIGRTPYELGWITLEDRARLLKELLSHGRIDGLEMNCRKKDGSLMVGMVKGERITLNGRNCLLIVTEDITERKRAEEAALLSREQVQAVVQTANDAIITVDAEQRITLWNAAAERIFGYPAEEMLGQPILQILPSQFREANQRAVEQVISGGEARLAGKTVEAAGLHKDGHEIPIEMSFATWKSQAGAFATSIIRDISERKQRERELQAIATLSAALRTVPSRAEMLPTIVQQLVNLLHCDAITIEMIEPHSGDTLVEAGYGLWNALIGQRQGKDVGLNAQIRATLRPYHAHSNIQDPDCGYPDWAHAQIRDIAGTPLIAQEKLIGFIWVARITDDFGESEIRLLSAIADITANAIQRTTLHEQTRKDAADLAQAYNSTLEGWARALELRDLSTQGHTRRVVDLTVALARRMGVPAEALENIRRGALLHDIGKMGVPDSVLNKPGALDEREWEMMRRHPIYAMEMLKPIEYLRPALNIPYYHHEKWDGSGYPTGLKGEAIPLEARIFAVVDVWEALTADRIYRRAWSKEEAARYIRQQCGKQFDPAVVEAFFEIVQKEG